MNRIIAEGEIFVDVCPWCSGTFIIHRRPSKYSELAELVFRMKKTDISLHKTRCMIKQLNAEKKH